MKKPNFSWKRVADSFSTRSFRAGGYSVDKTAVVAASPDVVVAWLLPRDFGGSHDYVSLWPERICASYCRQ